MNNVNPMVMNINASLFQSEQRVRELSHLVKTLRRQLDAERRAYEQLNQTVHRFAAELEEYAKDLEFA